MMLAETLGEYLAPRKCLIMPPLWYWCCDLNENMVGEMFRTWDIRASVPPSGQDVSECAVRPGVAPTGDKRACYSVAE